MSAAETEEALMFALDSIKAGLLVLTDRLDVIENHLMREDISFRPAETDHIGEAFREKWAHMLDEA